MYHSFRNINFKLNNQTVNAASLELSQEANIIHPLEYGNRTSFANIIGGGLKGTCRITYQLTGQDFIKDYIYSNENYPLSGNIGGLTFSQGYISSYEARTSPHNAINITTQIDFYDPINGGFTPSVALNVNSNVEVLRSAYMSFIQTQPFSQETFNNINDIAYSYRAEILPVYYSSYLGRNNINPDRVVITSKQTNLTFTCDSTNIPLSFSGQQYAAQIKCNHSTNTGIYETFNISGVLDKKAFAVTQGGTHKTTLSITQLNLGNKVGVTGYNLITGLVITGNGIGTSYTSGIQILGLIPSFFTQDGKVSFVEKVKVGDTYLPFIVERNNTNDVITTTITQKAIDGNVFLETTLGTFVYPPVALSYRPIIISGFTPITGAPGSLITITGLFFDRVNKVYCGNVNCAFQLNTTGNTNSIIATIPTNATNSLITLISSPRNLTGVSSGFLYIQPQISTLIPTTGIFDQTITLSGSSFTGITALLFNNIPSPSFIVIDSQTITGQIPSFGSGYTKGYVTISGQNGMIAKSYDIYRPHIPVSGFTPLSGTTGVSIVLTGLFDSGFLCLAQNGPVSTAAISGYKVAFGNITGTLYSSGAYTLTGLVPSGFFGIDYIYLFDPSGVEKYIPYSGRFVQVGPVPEIFSFDVNNTPTNILNLYKYYDLYFNGSFFKDFYGAGPFFTVFASGFTGNFNNVESNSFWNKLIVHNVRITGGFGKATTGVYGFYPSNAAGSGLVFPGLQLIVKSGIDEGHRARVSQYPTGGRSVTYNASRAVDSNLRNYSASNNFTADGSGLYNLIFKAPTSVSIIRISQSGMKTRFDGATLSTTGHVNLYGTGNILIASFSGLMLTGIETGFDQPYLNVAKMIISSSGTFTVNAYFGFSNISVY